MCATCENVVAAADELGLSVDERNIADPEYRAELRSHGGRVQVPYLIDVIGNHAMYESSAIIAYLERKYPKP
jgi:glutathione S-transferase